MAIIPNPILPPRTALWGLGFRFEMIGFDAQNLYFDIRDIWLLGKWLSYPLWVFAWGMFVSRDLVWETDTYITRMQSWISHLTDGWGIIEIIETLSYNLRLVVNNPLEFIRQNIRSLSFEIRMILDNADVWFRAKLNTNYPDLFEIVYNPWDWLRYKLYETFPGLTTFFSSPVNAVLGWIRYYFPFVTDLLNNPSGTIQTWIQQRYPWFGWFVDNPTDFIMSRIKGSNGELALFLTDPVFWFLSLFAGLLGVSGADLIDLPRTLFRVGTRVILESWGTFRDEVENGICDIILKFI